VFVIFIIGKILLEFLGYIFVYRLYKFPQS